MGYTAPRTWVSGEVVTHTLMNTHVRDNLLALSEIARTWTAAQTFNDDIDIKLGTGADAAIRWSDGDADNHALAIGLGNSNQSLHVTDLAAIATDWNIAATTDPNIYIHSNTTPATDYLRLGGHTGSAADIDVVGGSTLNFKIGGATEVSLTASKLDIANGTQLDASDTTQTTSTTTGSIITAGGLAVAKDVYLGGRVHLGANAIGFGANDHVKLVIDDYESGNVNDYACADLAMYYASPSSPGRTASGLSAQAIFHEDSATGTVAHATAQNQWCGVKGGITNSDGNTLPYATGVQGRVTAAAASAVITQGAAFATSAYWGASNGTATITDLFGLHVVDAVTTGTVTNLYGIKIEALAGGSNNWAIKTAGAGLVDIGDSTNATSTTTGSIHTAGGLSVAAGKDTWLGGDLHVGDDATEVNIKTANSNASALPFRIQHSRGSQASPSATQNNDGLGQIMFGGYTNQWWTGAVIEAEATETWSSGAAGTQLIFSTTDNTTTGVDERMFIDQNGGVYLIGATGTSGHGAGTFNATAIYDDNSIITDYVFEDDYREQIPTIPEMRDYYEQNHHLPTIPGREEWEEAGSLPLGRISTAVWETTEVHAIYIAELEERLKALESREGAVNGSTAS